MTILDVVMPDQVIKDSIDNTLQNQIGKETLIFIIIIVLAIIIISILAFLRINKKGNIQIDTEIKESVNQDFQNTETTEVEPSDNEIKEKKEE